MEVREFNLDQAKIPPSLHLKDGSSGYTTPEPTISGIVGEKLQLQRMMVNLHNQPKPPSQHLLYQDPQVRAIPFLTY